MFQEVYDYVQGIEKMPRKIEMVGRVFGKWTVLTAAGSDKNGKPFWLCECTCGLRKTVVGESLRAGLSQSCHACTIRRGSDSPHYIGRGDAIHTRLYVVWAGMLARCRDPNHVGYQYYGARGIRVCSRWEDFALFAADMEPDPGKGWTLERIDNDLGYFPKNVCWADWDTQAKNRRKPVRGQP